MRSIPFFGLWFPVAAAAFAFGGPAAAQPGLLALKGKTIFPIGSYELPASDADLRAMAEAGINLVRGNTRRDFDRVAAAGMLGWLPLPLHVGVADGRLRAQIEDLKDHSALAVWEGPDEIVWNFTAFSGLFRNGTFPTRDEWWRQTPLAVDYSEREAARIMPNIREAITLIRRLDTKKRPVWINEAARSDLKFIRQYLDHIDITGCDLYPIHAARRDPAAIADITERYKRVGKGRPVWMVLQGFSWGELAGREEPITYPTFAETRMMAWSAIAHGARGVLYWGMDAAPPRPAFRQSLYALTGELAALQPMLVAPDVAGARVEVIDSEDLHAPGRGVASLVRKTGGEWLVVLVNEDDRPHYGVVVAGLAGATRLELLYGSENVTVQGGEFVTRLLPYQVKVFASSRRWETARREGRAFSAP